jgi:hypothetical protein
VNVGPPAAVPLGRTLSQLVADRATGALHVECAPGGAIYLVEGQIGYAESPATPGVGQRLMACGRLPETVWQAMYDAGHGDQHVGRLLVEHGHLIHGELVSRVLAATYDAAYAILTGDRAPAAQFVSGERHWLGLVTAVSYTAVERETTRRRLLLRDLPATDLPAAELPAPQLPAPQLPATELPATVVASSEQTGAEPPARELTVPVVGVPVIAQRPIRPTMIVIKDEDHAVWSATAPAGTALAEPPLPKRLPARPPNAGPLPEAPATGGGGPDYATLKRIRAALKAVS